QGSHLSNDEQAAAVTRLVADGKVDPCLSKTYAFDDIPECHQLMLENNHPYGNMAVLVNARTPGQGVSTLRAVRVAPCPARRRSWSSARWPSRTPTQLTRRRGRSCAPAVRSSSCDTRR